MLLAFCLLLSCTCANALTMEQAVLEKLPQTLFQMLNGFDLLYEDEYGQLQLMLAQDEQDDRLLVLGEPEAGEFYGVKLETIAEALLCYAAGVDALPEGEAPDLRFLADTVVQLRDAFLNSAVITTEKDESTGIKVLDVKVSPKQLLTDVDAIIQAQLESHAADIDAVLVRYAPVLKNILPEADGLTAEALTGLWNELALSELLPADLPLRFLLKSSGTITAPWDATLTLNDASVSVHFSGRYLIATLSADGESITFDSRDVDKLWQIAVHAWNNLPAEAFECSISKTGFVFKVDPSLLAREYPLQLYAGMYANKQELTKILADYAPLLGISTADSDEWLPAVYAELNMFFLRLLRTPHPAVEVRAEWRRNLFELSATVDDLTGHITLTPSSVDVLIPTRSGVLSANGVLNRDSFVLNANLAGDPYTVYGSRADGQWTIDVFDDGEQTGAILADACGIRVFEVSKDSHELLFTAAWNDRSLQLTALDIFSATLFFHNKGFSWNIGDFDLTCTGQLSWDKALVFDVELQDPAYNRNNYSYEYDTTQLSLRLDHTSLKAEYRYSPYAGMDSNYNYSATEVYAVDISWLASAPHLQFSSNLVYSPLGASQTLMSFHYRPGYLEYSDRFSTWLITGSSAVPGRSNRIQVLNTRDVMRSAPTPSAVSPVMLDILSSFSANTYDITVEGEENFNLRITTGPIRMTAADLAARNVKMLDVRGLLELLGLNEAQPDALARTSLPEETVAQTAAAPAVEEVFTASAQGFAGPVAVKVTLANGKITAIEIGDAQFCETPGFGAKALEPAFQDQFIGKTLPLTASDIDGIAGATITTKAVLEAVNSIGK